MSVNTIMSPVAALTPAFNVAALPPGSSPRAYRTVPLAEKQRSAASGPPRGSNATTTSNCGGALVARRQSSTRARTADAPSRVATTTDTEPTGTSSPAGGAQRAARRAQLASTPMTSGYTSHTARNVMTDTEAPTSNALHHPPMKAEQSART